jgi:quercetin dioxygenase-like cupin family protein
MSDQNFTFSPDAQARVEAFLSAVDNALSEAGFSQAERQNVAEDLRAQITEMVKAQVAAQSRPATEPATIDDVAAVLAQLDPPEAYAGAAEEEPVAVGAATGKAPDPQADAGPSQHGSHHGSCGHAWHRGHGRRRWWARWKQHGAVAAAIRSALAQSNPFAGPPLSLFNDRARRVVAHAKNEARRWKHDYIGTEHVLIGLALEEGGLAAIILKSLGLDASRLRDELKRLAKEGTEPVTADLIPVTPRTQRSFREAVAAARALGSDSVATEHLLLGLIEVPDGLAARVLIEAGAPLDKIKAEVLKAAGSRGSQPRTAAAFSFWPPGTAKVIALAGESYTLVATGSETGGSYAVIELHSPAGSAGLPAHTLLRSDLALYVQQGSLRVATSDRSVDVPAGGFANIPRGMPHTVRNVTDFAAKAMLVLAPAGLEAMLADLGTPAPDAAAPPKTDAAQTERLIAAAPKYGVEFQPSSTHLTGVEPPSLGH